jgi:hypothetical protein
MEALESRQLLAADLTGSFAAMPVGTINGSKAKVGVEIQNLGDTRFHGKVAIQYYAVADGEAFDPATAHLLATSNSSLSLKAGASISKTVSLPIGATAAAGNYRIFAVIDPHNRIVESNESNNVIESDVLAVAQRQVDLSSSITFKSTPKVFAGSASRGTARVTITNTGTQAAAANQIVDLSVVARPVGASDPSQDILLSSGNARINVSSLAPGASRTINVPVTFPANLTEGSFNLVSNTNFAATGQAAGTSQTPVMLETNTLNNAGFLATPVVVNTAPTPLPEEPPTSPPVIIPVVLPPTGGAFPGTSIDNTPGGLVPTSGSFNLSPTFSLSPTIGSQAIIPSTGSVANAGFTTAGLISVSPTPVGSALSPTSGLIGTSNPFLVNMPTTTSAATFSSSFGSSASLGSLSQPFVIV